MSRRRYLSTDISLDARVNRLATTAGDFAALMYTWLIPHAEDDASLPADPEELLFKVLPGRRDKTVQDVQDALQAMFAAALLIRGEQRIFFPPDAFYRYQTYIPVEKRRSAKNAEERREPAKITSSPSPSFSPSFSFSKEDPANAVQKPSSKGTEAGKRKRRLPSKQEEYLTAAIKQWAQEKGYRDPESLIESFEDYHRAKNSIFADWEAALRTWVRNDFKFNGKPPEQNEWEKYET